MKAAPHHRSITSSATAAPLMIGVLLGASALFAARRLAGAFESALPPVALVATVVFIGVAIWLVRVVWPQFRAARGLPGGASFEALLVAWGPAVAIFLAMAAFSWPMARLVDWIVWLPILAGEAALLRGANPGSLINALRSFSPRASSASPADEPADPILQQLTRIRYETTGGEAIFGTVRAEFAASQRVAVLHVAFCPPLEETPKVHAEQAEGPNATVRVTHILPQGARIEVRLAREPDEPTPVIVDFAAY